MAKSAGTVKTPGSVLQKYIDDYKVSVSAVSNALGQNAQTFKKILTGEGKINIELGFLLAKLFGTTPEFWFELQKKAGIAKAKKDTKFQKKLGELKKLPKPEKGAKAPRGGRKPGKKGAVKKTAAKKPAAKKVGRKPRAAKTITPSSSSSSSSNSSFSL